MSDSREVTVPIIGTVTKNGTGSWTAEYLGILAYGATQATARANLADAVRQVVQNGRQGPAFARDDDGTLIVSVPNGVGSETWRVTDERARMTSHSHHTPADSVADVWHYTAIPS